MKRQIRRGVFETNSSSQHSLCIMKKDEHYTPDEIAKDFYLWDDKEAGEKDCEWHIWDHDMEFGRSPFRALGNFHDKWLYACASLVHEYNDENYKKLETLALKYVPGLKKIVIPMTSDSIADKNYPENKIVNMHKSMVRQRMSLMSGLNRKRKIGELIQSNIGKAIMDIFILISRIQGMLMKICLVDSLKKRIYH